MRGAPPTPGAGRLLLATALIIATCGLVYELVAGALASYLLGDSVTQFSLIIGAYLSAMGVGSYLSRFIERNLLSRFVEIEVAVALVGGFEAPALFAAFTWTSGFEPLLYTVVGVIGMLVGLELPLLMRLLEKEQSLKDLVARVLFLDYVGALFASLLFPLLLVPQLGLLRTSLAFGILNAVVALGTTLLFEGVPERRWRLRGLALGAILLLSAAFLGAGRFESQMERALFADPVMMSQITPYQKITVTHRDGDTRLFLDGALQFSTVDEYRYHEALVHPAMGTARDRSRVLILGGGDGLAAREVLRWPEVQAVTLVDLDPAMTELFTERAELAELNGWALQDERVTVVNDDAFQWLRTGTEEYGVVVIDFPDPNNYALGKLYTNAFFRILKGALGDGAVVGMQATSPLFSRDAYWCIATTVESEGYTVRPYHAYVPSFGEWGFLLFGEGLGELGGVPEGLRSLDREGMERMFYFPPDMRRREGVVNRLDNQVLVSLYERDWRRVVGM